MKKIYCSNCGTLIPDTAKYCFNCGAAVTGPQAGVFRAQDPPIAQPQLVTNLPKQAQRTDVEYIQRTNLPADAVIFFFMSFFVKSFIIFALVAVGAFLQPNPFVFAVVLYFVLLSIITLFVYNNFLYEVDQDGLKIESGVIHKHQVSVPYEQIQNVNIERTVFDRIFNLARISIETAGNSNGATPGSAGVLRSKSEAYIPGLHMDQAKIIHDLLIDGADGVMGDGSNGG